MQWLITVNYTISPVYTRSNLAHLSTIIDIGTEILGFFEIIGR